MRNIKLDAILLAVGYTVSNWRSNATRQLQKVGFTKDESSVMAFITEEKAIELLNYIANSGSKYKATAKELLATDLPDELTCSEEYVPVNLSKTAKATSKSTVKKDHITFDLKEFIETVSSLEEFEKFRANKYQA